MRIRSQAPLRRLFPCARGLTFSLTVQSSSTTHYYRAERHHRPRRRARGSVRGSARGAAGQLGTLARLRRIALIAALVAVIPVAISYTGAMSQPSNSSLGIRTVEWLRDNGAAGLVAQVESIYYSLTAPSKGGPGLRSLPTVGYNAGSRAVAGGGAGSVAGGAAGGGSAAAGATGSASAGTATAGGAAGAGATPGSASAPALPPAYRPPRVPPLLHPALSGEGVWRATRPSLAAAPPVMLTTLRDQPEYPRVVAGLAWIDPRRTRITLNPGRLEPAVTLPRGPMEVPEWARGRLLATFNSGFKLGDSHGGFVLHGNTYAPMQDGQGTLVGYSDGSVGVVDWTHGENAPPGVSFARQNLPLIVDHGQPTPGVANDAEWGATVGNAVLVWRSGIGVDARGDLIYAAGEDQTVASLARVLARAGAVRAMELDINSYWVSFITYGAPGAAEPHNLLSGMERSNTRYLEPDDRDFLAVYAK